MRKDKIRKYIRITSLSAVVVIAGLILYAYAGTWGKTELEFKIHINEDKVLQSVYGESPTFAIWIETPEVERVKTIFVTARAGYNDWEGKAEVPVALPRWEEIHRMEQQAVDASADAGFEVDAISGATPEPGYFTSRVRVSPDSRWICWIEMNLAGDYNEHYKEYDEISRVTDEFGSGQPAIIYKAAITAKVGEIVTPEVIGISVLNGGNDEIIQPLKGITTALDVFDEIKIEAMKPKPKIIR